MYLDVLQFAYKPQRVTEDVYAHYVDTIAKSRTTAKHISATPPPHSHPPQPPVVAVPQTGPHLNALDPPLRASLSGRLHSQACETFLAVDLIANFTTTTL